MCSIDQGRSLLHDWYILRLPLRRDVPPFNASASDKMCSTGARWTGGVETFALPNHRLRLGVPERGGRCLVRRDARRGSFPVKATGSCHAITLVHSLVSEIYLVTIWCPFLPVGGDKWMFYERVIESFRLLLNRLTNNHISELCYTLLQFSTDLLGPQKEEPFKHCMCSSQITAISFIRFVDALPTRAHTHTQHICSHVAKLKNLYIFLNIQKNTQYILKMFKNVFNICK